MEMAAVGKSAFEGGVTDCSSSHELTGGGPYFIVENVLVYGCACHLFK
jgi:hypothetical protein